jgi:protocatechuate 3,4-dioxygenase alpha subunit
MSESTPSQTVGPFLAIALPWPDGPDAVTGPSGGEVLITGRLFDGAGEPVPDGLIETWQADPDGRFDHPDDPRGAVRFPGFRGFGRCPTDADGTYRIRTLKPGALPTSDGEVEAPHLDVTVFARGLLRHLVTRLYFPDEAQANSADPVLRQLSAADREALTAVPDGPGRLRFDIRLQGDGETPFFTV